MAMNRDLFLAILSMDSYNRGYVQGIKGLDSPGPNPDDDLKIRIGKAKITRDAKTKRCANVSRTKARRHEDGPPSSRQPCRPPPVIPTPSSHTPSSHTPSS